MPNLSYTFMKWPLVATLHSILTPGNGDQYTFCAPEMHFTAAEGKTFSIGQGALFFITNGKSVGACGEPIFTISSMRDNCSMLAFSVPVDNLIALHMKCVINEGKETLCVTMARAVNPHFQKSFAFQCNNTATPSMVQINDVTLLTNHLATLTPTPRIAVDGVAQQHGAFKISLSNSCVLQGEGALDLTGAWIEGASSITLEAKGESTLVTNDSLVVLRTNVSSQYSYINITQPLSNERLEATYDASSTTTMLTAYQKNEHAYTSTRDESTVGGLALNHPPEGIQPPSQKAAAAATLAYLAASFHAAIADGVPQSALKEAIVGLGVNASTQTDFTAVVVGDATEESS